MTTAGVREIAVKNGRNSVALFTDGSLSRVPTPEVTNVRDTTGAGDSSNAGYLAGRLVGMLPAEACELGQELAGEVINNFGALAPEYALERFRQEIRRRDEKG
jgi:2-dehydro-3-deoxygluconokinase